MSIFDFVLSFFLLLNFCFLQMLWPPEQGHGRGRGRGRGPGPPARAPAAGWPCLPM